MPKIVLITGASTGIGRATAEHLTRLGYRVYGTSRRAFAEPVSFQTLVMDVMDAASIQRAVDEVVARENRLDVLINNAGLGIISAIEEVPEPMIEQLFQTNVWGLLRTCKAVLPVMRRQRSGLIINISSIAGTMALPMRGIYNASKAAVEIITESLSMETRQFGIRVCSVLPGDVRTSINQNRLVNESEPDSPYFEMVRRLNRQVKEEVSSADDPLYIARTIERVLNDPSPKLHYVAGPPIQKLAIWLKKILPGRLFERIIMKRYGMLNGHSTTAVSSDVEQNA